MLHELRNKIEIAKEETKHCEMRHHHCAIIECGGRITAAINQYTIINEDNTKSSIHAECNAIKKWQRLQRLL